MLTVYNSFSRKKEPFQPLEPGKIGLYVCGMTVYDYCHLGHARVMVAFDAITRFLRHTGWDVQYVRNITDIDDKIIKRANENGEPHNQLTERFIQAMHDDAAKLGVLPPNQEPKATDTIDAMLGMINTLMEKNCAYQASNGDVYFSVESYAQYGELARKNLDDMQVGERVGADELAVKKSPLDFVLWKIAKPDEPSWDSPWGKGRPGWHIECSAMSTQLLGHTFDIHGGGADLLFPHHENERAQSECATGCHFANTWMHVGFVQVDNEKMSKSLGNFFTIREILEQFDAEVVRLFLLSSHYRSQLNYSLSQLEQTQNSLDTLYQALRGLDLDSDIEIDDQNVFRQRFDAAMNDDFNTPEAIAVLFDVAKLVNTAKQEGEDYANELGMILCDLGEIIGLLERDPEDYFKRGDVDPAQVEALIQQRNDARASKDWVKADEVRDRLSEMGIVLEDNANGTIWRKS